MTRFCKLTPLTYLSFLATIITSVSNVGAQECAAGSAKEVAGNWYCSPVKAIKYENFPGHGYYNKVTNMNADTGECTTEKHQYSGSLSPLNEELSLHIRGPTWLQQVAIYTLEDQPKSKQKREIDMGRHAHKQHGIRPSGHGSLHNHHNAAKKRAVGDVVKVIMDGKLVSWVNEYAGPDAPTQKHSTTAKQTENESTPQTTTASPSENKAKATSTENPEFSAISDSSDTPSGGWKRRAFYNAEDGKAQGLTFLNHFGGTKGIPGTAAGGPAFGASLSYASSDGKSGAASPQTFKNAMIDDDDEIIIMSDKSCDDGGCGYTRPGGVAHHGFAGSHKIFLLQFTMPMTGKSGFNGDMPGIWLLNAQVPRTSQYGTNSECSCWTSGCGEVDLFEVLDSHNTRCKSTLHMAPAGGSSDYFDRPVDEPMTAAVIFSGDDENVVIRVLKKDEVDFADKLDAKMVENWVKDQSSAFKMGT